MARRKAATTRTKTEAVTPEPVKARTKKELVAEFGLKDVTGDELVVRVADLRDDAKLTAEEATRLTR